MKKVNVLVLLLLASLMLTETAQAIGVLYSRPLRSDQTYDKMWIKTVDAKVEIDGQVSVTYVDQVFRNEMNQVVESVWIFPLPEGAVVTELFYWFNGKRYQGTVREREEAQQAYNDRIRQMLDPALLEYLGDNLYRLSIAPINANSDVRTEITYVQMLPYEFGQIDYKFLLNAVEMSPKPLNRVSITGTIKNANKFKSMKSSTHSTSSAMALTKVNSNEYTLVFGDENFTPDKDLSIQFETVRDAVDVNVISYTPTEADDIGTDSYYAVWITPPDQIGNDEVIPKKIVFTADVSSSMEGERIDQLKQALMAFLDNLSQDDQFNIVTFGTTVLTFKDDLVQATPPIITEARAFVEDIGAFGLTNIDLAMEKSLAQSFSDEFANTIVFMTDGYPTWGETFVPNIVQNVANRNTQDVRIFSFGVGENISKALLVQLARDNGGYSEFITQDDDIATVIGNHFIRISKPVLTDLDIKINGLTTSDKFPRPLQDLFWGSQVMQLGIYKNNGTFPLYLTGNLRNKAVSFTSSETFSTEPGGHRFIPRLWAKEKINYLLEQIEIYGEQDELVNQVIELSIKFQILTPYTAFYSDPNEPGAKVDEKDNNIPTGFVLHQNYPNPFNPTTTISYELPANGSISLKIFDITGRLVTELLNTSQQAGMHTTIWNGCDQNGKLVAAGIYIYQLEFTDGNGKTTILHKKMSLVK